MNSSEQELGLANPSTIERNRKEMSDSTYKRTTRYRNFINQRIYLPFKKGSFALFSEDVIYQMLDSGWRRIKKEKMKCQELNTTPIIGNLPPR